MGKANSMGEDRYLKLEDVQIRFGVSRTTLWRWREDRGLRVTEIGGIKRIKETDLHDFLDRHLQGKPGAN